MRLKSMGLKVSLQGRKDHGSGQSGHTTSPLPVLTGLPQPPWKKHLKKLQGKGLGGSELCFVVHDRNVTPTPTGTKGDLVACRIQRMTPRDDLASGWAWGAAGSARLSALSSCQLSRSNSRPTSSQAGNTEASRFFKKRDRILFLIFFFLFSRAGLAPFVLKLWKNMSIKFGGGKKTTPEAHLFKKKIFFASLKRSHIQKQ